MKKPNLFHYATSELSQDAFICWLLEWAKPENKRQNEELNLCGVDILKAFFYKHKKEFPNKLLEIEVFKQDKNIDILCLVNNEYAIIIEDKIATSNHSNQLERYLQEIKGRGFDNDKIIPIYLKTIDQSDYTNIKENGYQVFNRKDFISILKKYPEIKSDIFNDFRERLEKIEEEVNSYEILSIHEWNRNSWIGFYLKLQEKLGSGAWDYVSNPNGGFLGFWWNFIEKEDYTLYLQIEQSKMCFKIRVDDTKKRVDIRAKFSKIVCDESDKFGLSLKKPNRFGHGLFMTIAVFELEFRKINEEGIINIDLTVEELKKAMKLIDYVTR